MKRSLIVGSAASLSAIASLIGASGPPTVAPSDTPVHSASAFADSIGMNIHLSYGDTGYADLPTLRTDLQQLGVKHVRDGLRSTDPSDWVYPRARSLRDAGIDFNWIIGDPKGRSMSGTPAQIVSTLTGPLAGTFTTLEGPNEYDCNGSDPSWPATLRTYQADLARSVNRVPSLAAVPLLAPSLCAYGSRPALGNMTAHQDAGNIHPYPGGRAPERNIVQEMSEERAVSGTQPQYATETGYHMPSASDDEWNRGVSERLEATYVPRLFLSYFARGVVRTFYYQLYDIPAAADGTATDQRFGLIRADGSRRPAFYALQRLLASTKDSKPARPGPSTIPVRIQSTSSVERLLLARSDGSYDLVLWRPVEPSATGTFSTVPVTVGLPVRSDVTLTRPSADGSSSRLPTGTSVALALAGDVVVLRLTPRAQ